MGKVGRERLSYESKEHQTSLGIASPPVGAAGRDTNEFDLNEDFAARGAVPSLDMLKKGSDEAGNAREGSSSLSGGLVPL